MIRHASPSIESDGIHELTTDISGSPYYSHDMAPVPRAGRRWGMKDIAVLWISMSACIPTYMLASGLIGEGMNWWQAILTIFLIYKELTALLYILATLGVTAILLVVAMADLSRGESPAGDSRPSS